MTDEIDYDLPATVFTRTEGDLPGAESYVPVEFPTLAEAIKHAVENLDREADFYISGATTRLDRGRIVEAYESAAFPLERTG